MRRQCAILLMVTALFCGVSEARTIEGVVVDSTVGTVLQGAIVALKDSSGAVLDYTVTDASGGFSMNPDMAGMIAKVRHLIKVEEIQ